MDTNSQPVKPNSSSGNTKTTSRNGAVKIFKVALFMIRRRHSKKPKASVDMGADKGLWRRLLGSIRPLHIHGNEPPPTAARDMSLPPSKPKEDFEEALMPLPSHSTSPSSSSLSRTSRSSSFGTSQYASASSLQEFDDNTDGDDDENEIHEDNGGDEMIDAKAEEFIAQFYEQMRRQRYNNY
ncbi:uncharacterized protein LOC105436176 [Cucumis sativus]|uniref:Cotton fiber protein n=1 Tax=Cucumis sativus TaxID=3659 RepID=A0A0A0KB64_CUCSA|nr:uncharacterized protein LOC105436176 [Cucumis sativus]